MEQNFDSPAPIVAEEKKTCSCEGGCKCKKGKKGLIITTVIMAILAVAGCGFGVYGMINSSNKDNEISDLKNRAETKCDAAENTAETTEETQQKSTEPATTPTNTVTTPSNTAPYIKKGYFYVPEWGLKFKIPEDLTDVGYSVDYSGGTPGEVLNSKDLQYSIPSIGFTATIKSDIKNGQDRTHDDIKTCTIVSVTKQQADWGEKERAEIGGIIKKFDGYKLLIWDHSSHGSCLFPEIADKAQTKIQAMFSNPEKI